EADNINSERSGEALDTAPISNPTISNLTCVLSNSDTGTHSDVSEGPLFRQGTKFHLADSIIFGGYLGNSSTASNECLEIQSPESLAFAQSGESTLNTTIVACVQADAVTDPTVLGTLANGDSLAQWVLGTS